MEIREIGVKSHKLLGRKSGNVEVNVIVSLFSYGTEGTALSREASFS